MSRSASRKFGRPEDVVKRGITVLLSLAVLVSVAYLTASKWAIRHETIAFHDPARDNRLVPVHVAVRRDKEMQANAGMIKLPVAIINHGNTVKGTSNNDDFVVGSSAAVA